jgi:hypothetical protein
MDLKACVQLCWYCRILLTKSWCDMNTLYVGQAVIMGIPYVPVRLVSLL